jgi:hypothetical protein
MFSVVADSGSARPPAWLVAVAAVAVIAGVYARFKGLGTWPFGVDEYYFGRSVQNVLSFGVPAYECGGYYVRGLLLQYLSAGLQWLGMSPELAPRAIAAVASLAALPAAFLLARRIHGTSAGLLVVALLAVSVWEVEMGRFGRFYAPFQAIFLWYMVYFLRYTVDRQRHALWGMVLLSLLGVLVWEGAVLLLVANLLPPFLNHAQGRLVARQWGYLAGMALLLLALNWFVELDLRRAGDSLPPDYRELLSAGAEPAGPRPLFVALLAHPGWWLPGLLPLALAGASLRWIGAFRHRWLAAAGLLVALFAALAHQFLVAGAALGLLLLLNMVALRELLDRRALPYFAALAAAAVFWLAFGLITTGWRGDAAMSPAGVLVALAYQFVGFPNVLDMVARTWTRAVPVLSLGLFALVAVAGVRAIVRPAAVSPAERALLAVAVVMLLLVGLAQAPRLETRYSFFLYPVLLVVAVAVLFRATEAVTRSPAVATALGCVLAAAGFALTEDFDAAHLANIDSAEVNFRLTVDSRLASHYYGRSDIRATADWLAANVNGSRDLVISGPGVASLDFYYPQLGFVYLEPDDQRLSAWACQQGTIERWSNLPLVYRLAELEARILASERAFIVIDPRREEEFLSQIERLRPEVAWRNEYGHHAVIAFRAAGNDSDMGVSVRQASRETADYIE